MKKLNCILFLSFVCSFVSLQAQKSPHKKINLGETPWKFHKVENANIKDFSSELNINYQKDSLNKYTIQFDFKKEMNGSNLKLSYVDKSIRQAEYLVEGLHKNGNWIVISDRSKNSVEGIQNYYNDVDETGTTVGLVRKQRGVYFNVKIIGDFQKIRILGLAPKDRWETRIIEEQPEITLLKTVSSTKKFAAENFEDSNWEDVGIPHCFNDNDTYLNANKAEMWRGEVWYRKKKFLSKNQKKKNFKLEFQGVNIGAAIYINGQFIKGNVAVKQNDEVTHVGGFLPFSLDITSVLKFGEENTIAVRVSNELDGFYINPGFGNYEGFGMGWGGIVSPVYLHENNSIHIPLNAPTPEYDWGNYIATTDISENSAILRVLTNVSNTSTKDQKITVVTELYNATGDLVYSQKEKQTLHKNSNSIFDFKSIVKNPTLWYPNNSSYGTPYLYTLKTKILKGKKCIDIREDKIGIRKITWDEDYCYVNGKKHFLQGFGHRNIYPALGSAVPEELQWKDIQLIAEAGGNVLRVGHVPATKITVEACDAYGILLFQNSGDNEWVLKGATAKAYKTAYDKEMILAFRNHPSVGIWESNNGLPRNGEIYHAYNTYKIVQELDSLQPRIVHNRDRYPREWPDSIRVMVGYTNGFRKVKGSPTLNTEVYGAIWGGKKSWNISRDDYQNELAFTDYFVNNYLRDVRKKACGWIDWMLAETQGEGYTIYLNGKSKQKSLGSSAMDGNRIPKLKYKIYKNALWIPFEKQPGVVLQSSWNLDSIQTISAWSNCPKVALFLNGENLGERIPDKESKKIQWENIAFEAGILKIIGYDFNDKQVCEDIRLTAAEPHHIELIVEENTVKTTGEKFAIKANGSDAAIITARIVDKNGNLCVDANNSIEFSVEGSATYRGSYDFYITPNKPLNYHAPGDKELRAEGGLRRIAIRSAFFTGIVRVKAISKGLKSAETSYRITPIK